MAAEYADKATIGKLLGMNNEAVQDWLKVRRLLLDMETEFTSLAIAVASGSGSETELLQKRELLEATRELCAAAFRRAFPRTHPDAPPQAVPVRARTDSGAD